MISKIFEFLGSLGSRAKDNKNTTIGGGVVGVAVMALIGKLEADSGCHFQEAFAGLDWVQVAGYVIAQVFGMSVTDSKKTV